MPLITDSVGRVLGKRYRLVAPLGAGASAHVFLAEDVSLQRQVAVKVLQPALARDAAFLKRFGAEARSVASLNHPHVLRVFDWGEDVDGPYLVLEYLGGGSLRDLLDGGSRLDQAQTARLGIEVAQGLAYAHARGLVHRDVKPANLLFDEEGRVRVADFGVARALAEAAWTEPVGAMVGTARYASPEQAEGRPVDGRSDVYSLALVLYECLTGTVPFVTDTTVGTLMARVGALLPEHPAIGPLASALAWAAAPWPQDRLDASQLVARLEAVTQGLPAPAPLPLRAAQPTPSASTGHQGSNGLATGPGAAPPDDRTGRMGEWAPSSTVVAAPGAPAAGAAAQAPVGFKAGPGEVFDGEALGDGAAAASRTPGRTARGAAVPSPPEVRQPRRRRRWPWAAALVAVVLVAAGAVYAVREKVFTPSRPVPGLVGLSLASARQAADRGHFTLAVDQSAYSVTVPAGAVVSQDPAASAMAKEGTAVAVVESEGPPPVVVPSLGGVDCATAQRLLAVSHLSGVCPPTVAAYSSTIPAGQVINWAYDHQVNVAHAPYGAVITIAISKGPPPVPVPTVTGPSSTYQSAAAALQRVGLAATETTQSSTSVPAGQVVGTSPGAGTPAPYGSTVTVVVSSGPPMVDVPNVDGMSLSQATAALQNDGLSVGQVYGPPGGQVFDTVPAIGSSVQEGSAVTLYTI